MHDGMWIVSGVGFVLLVFLRCFFRVATPFNILVFDIGGIVLLLLVVFVLLSQFCNSL